MYSWPSPAGLMIESEILPFFINMFHDSLKAHMVWNNPLFAVQGTSAHWKMSWWSFVGKDQRVAKTNQNAKLLKLFLFVFQLLHSRSFNTLFENISREEFKKLSFIKNAGELELAKVGEYMQTTTGCFSGKTSDMEGSKLPEKDLFFSRTISLFVLEIMNIPLFLGPSQAALRSSGSESRFSNQRNLFTAFYLFSTFLRASLLDCQHWGEDQKFGEVLCVYGCSVWLAGTKSLLAPPPSL